MALLITAAFVIVMISSFKSQPKVIPDGVRTKALKEPASSGAISEGTKQSTPVSASHRAYLEVEELADVEDESF